MKRMLCLLLALLTMIPLLIACSDGEKPSLPTGDTTAAITGGDTDPAETRDPYDHGVEQIDYKEWDFVIVAPQPKGAAYFDREEMTQETVNDAIYTRNRLLEEYFNITIRAENMGWTSDMSAHFKSYLMSGEDKVGMAAVGFTQGAKPMITDGVALPWNEVPSIDLSEVWWNESVTKTMAVMGNYYYLSGDINWTSMQFTTGWFFNKDVAKNNKLPDLYQAVRDGKWTWDMASNLMKGMTRDNGDGTWNEQDSYGHVQYVHSLEGWLYGADYQTVYFQEDGAKMNFFTEKMNNIVNHLYNMIHVQRISYMTDDAGAMSSIFFDNRALFLTATLEFAEGWRSYETDFGILPNPKYDEKQKEYRTVSDQWGLVCCIPSTTTNFKRTGDIVEVMACLSHQLVRSAYYDKTLIGKGIRDDESEEMLDIIYKGILYDSGQCYMTNLEWLPLRATVAVGNSDLTSWWRANQSQISKNYEELYDYVKLQME